MEDRACARGEPTKSVVTAILVQPATAAGPGRSPPDEVFVDAGYVSAPALLRALAGGYELVGPAPTPPHGRRPLRNGRVRSRPPRPQGRLPGGRRQPGVRQNRRRDVRPPLLLRLARQGLRRCRYKGRAKTGLQAQLTATACNLRRWARRLCREERKKA